MAVPRQDYVEFGPEGSKSDPTDAFADPEVQLRIGQIISRGGAKGSVASSKEHDTSVEKIDETSAGPQEHERDRSASTLFRVVK